MREGDAARGRAYIRIITIMSRMDGPPRPLSHQPGSPGLNNGLRITGIIFILDEIVIFLVPLGLWCTQEEEEEEEEEKEEKIVIKQVFFIDKLKL